ncbi:MAG: serine/threonine-protein kinase [Cyanobacteria bacterium J06635_15]
MSLCLNPRCPQPDHPGNGSAAFCQGCGSELILQGRYRVMRLLSDRSGFGRVYEAYERDVPKLLKVLKESLNDTPKALELFEKEAVVLSQLNHPGIPRIEPDGYFTVLPKGPKQSMEQPLRCIIMEKIDGLNLHQWMQQQGNHPISEKQAFSWLQQLVEVLHLIHHKNYFHRDIKPENIMLRATGQLVLVDFGAARQITETYLAQLGQSGGITALSSAGYTPPEQEQGQAVPQSDFYALGRTFTYLLTAKHPTDQAIYNSYSNEFLWQTYAPQVSATFAQLLDDMIAPRAMDRPQDTDEILDRMHRMQASQTISLSTAPTLVAVPPQEKISATVATQGLVDRLPATTLQDGATQTIDPPRTKQRWWFGVAGLAALTAIAAGGIWYGWSRLAPPTTAQSPVEVSQKSVLLVRTLTGHTSSVNAIALIPGKNQLISGSADNTIKHWDLTTGGELKTLTGHSSYVNALALSPDGRILASGSADQTIRLWDITTGEILATLTGHLSPVNTLAISHSGRQLISGSADGTVKIWDIETQQERHSLQAHASAINALAVSSDDVFFATGSADRTIRLWDLTTGENQGVLRGHESYVNTLTTTPDGQYLISGSADTTIKLWQVPATEAVQTWLGHSSFVNDLGVTLDGQMLISASTDESIAFWDLKTGLLRYTTTGYDSYIDRVLLLPNGQLVTTRNNDSTIRVWLVQ